MTMMDLKASRLRDEEAYRAACRWSRRTNGRGMAHTAASPLCALARTTTFANLAAFAAHVHGRFTATPFLPKRLLSLFTVVPAALPFSASPPEQLRGAPS
jgi:hypothetical protein